MAVHDLVRRAGNFFRRDALDLVFPPTCVACDRLGTFLCERCDAALPLAAGPRCLCCWEGGLRGGALCAACRNDPPAFEALRAPYIFEGPARDAVHRLKYGGLAAAGETMGTRIASCWSGWGLMADLVVPVPLHPRRERQRGYNQADRLARSVAAVLDLEYEARALRRVRATPALASGGLGRDARRRAMAGAFAAADGAGRFAGRSIALIDDVATTGATLSAAARVLLDAGADSVVAAVFARDSAPGHA